MTTMQHPSITPDAVIGERYFTASNGYSVGVWDIDGDPFLMIGSPEGQITHAAHFNLTDAEARKFLADARRVSDPLARAVCVAQGEFYVAMAVA